MLMLAIDERVAKYGSALVGIYSVTSDPVAMDKMNKQLRDESLLALSQVLVRQHDPGNIFIPFHSIPFHSIPFHSIPFHSIPFHFYGAEGDYIIPASEVERLARMYNAPFTIYPGMSHAIQRERDWRTVAVDIQEWLSKL